MLRVLDLGGGAGQAAQVFAERGHFVHILDQYATNAIHPRMTISKGDLDQLGSEDWFDLILMNHVLEHVWSPRRMLSTASRHLAAGGVLFVEVPFELYTPFIKRRLGDPLHVGYFAVHTLRRYLEQCDLDPLWVRRALGQYNARRVMVLRAVARSCTPIRLQRRPSRLERRSLIPRLVLTPLEMLHPFQLALAAVRTRK
jgi:SAM-dependent methyltransferase